MSIGLYLRIAIHTLPPEHNNILAYQYEVIKSIYDTWENHIINCKGTTKYILYARVDCTVQTLVKLADCYLYYSYLYNHKWK